VGLISLKNKRLLWDFDSPIYASLFIAQKNAEEEGLDEVPISYACQSLKTSVAGFIEHVENDDVTLYMQGKDNFRKEIAKILPYKGNRPPKPALYDAVREYAVNYLGAILVDVMEAEDRVAIEYNLDPENSVFCAVDKDCLQVPGLHYDPQKKTTRVISPLEGNRRLFSQILTGDRIDNILGIPGLGDKAAERLTEGVRTFRQGWGVVKEQYYKAFGEQRCFQKETPKGLRWAFEKGSGLVCSSGDVLDWREALEETCHLVYLLRSEEDRFMVID